MKALLVAAFVLVGLSACADDSDGDTDAFWRSVSEQAADD